MMELIWSSVKLLVLYFRFPMCIGWQKNVTTSFGSRGDLTRTLM